ncbi:glycoside hydrolase family 43 protein [Enterococcus nangangensis]|uniref:glycoside hydrolase family 43 protein n=1 Tax=Enterococcus nangangensis TaxID=2559926 RepID=UPI0010F85C3E|nr:glycoside hydrolase family 43 protein [Enterococcus nangangensis]
MKNPILAGFAPDPSVCRVGEDYYLVTSTFSYFPGVPIYHSQNLVDWTQIGNVLERPSQLDLTGANHSSGIFAPTIRYREGTFYLITTNVTHGGNFIVTATDPRGPWSDPYFLPTAAGIDPSLFFDEDGKCYYVGTRPRSAGIRYDGDYEIWLQELDLTTMQLSGVSTPIWKGALRKNIWPEGPHLYKRNGFYYLLIAEGGTGLQHAISVARSTKIDGWYEGNPNNPIFTHRNLGQDYPIQNVGHGDLIEKADGTWALTCLASRFYEGYNNLGRETFLATVIWEADWPVVNPGVGKIMAEDAVLIADIEIDFKQGIPPVALRLRNPEEANYQVTTTGLQVNLTPITFADLASPSYLGLRQNSMHYCLQVEQEFTPENKYEEAGLMIIQSNQFAMRFVVKKVEHQVVVQVIQTLKGQDEILVTQKLPQPDVTLAIQQDKQDLSFWVEISGQRQLLIDHVSAYFLSTQVAGGFVGSTLGVYASSNGKVTKNKALFKRLSLQQRG